MNRKVWLLFLLFLALAALVMLASSLHDVHFDPGKQIAGKAAPTTGLLLPLTNQKTSSTPLWKIILIWAGFFICMVLFFYLLPPDVRKRVLLQAVRFGLAAFAVYFALRNRTLDLPNQNSGDAAQANAPLAGGPSFVDAPVFQPPALTPWMTYLVSLGVTLALLLLTWAAYRFWKRFGNRQPSSLEQIADIARASLHDIAVGEEFGDVIIQSYARMSEAVSQRRGLNRQEAMTPREFESRLERAGLPADAVKRLTRLFEAVRYGAHKSNQSDVNEAVACLNSILQACGVAQS